MNHNQLHCPCGGKIIEDDCYAYHSDDNNCEEIWYGHCEKCYKYTQGINFYQYTHTFCEDAVECD